jgi:hypothetical protein
MALKLSAPIEKTFNLEQTDKEFPPDEGSEPTSVTIKQATQAQHERRMELFALLRNKFSWDDDGKQTIESIENRNIYTVQRRDAFLTLAGCNIVIEPPKGSKPVPLFRFKDGSLDMTEDEFTEAWGRLPAFVAREIHTKVLEVNPTWRMSGEAD